MNAIVTSIPNASRAALAAIAADEAKRRGDSGANELASGAVSNMARSQLEKLVPDIMPSVFGDMRTSLVKSLSDGAGSFTTGMVETMPQGRESLSWLNRTYKNLLLSVASWFHKESGLQKAIDTFSSNNTVLDKPLADVAASLQLPDGSHVITAAGLKTAITDGVNSKINMATLLKPADSNEMAAGIYTSVFSYTSNQILAKMPEDKRDDPEVLTAVYSKAGEVAAMVSGVQATRKDDKGKPVFEAFKAQDGVQVGMLAYFTEAYTGKSPAQVGFARNKEAEAPKTEDRTLVEGIKPRTPIVGGDTPQGDIQPQSSPDARDGQLALAK